MEGTGEPIVTDAQYQAFAKKWSLAILAPDLYPKAGKDCFDGKYPFWGGPGSTFPLTSHIFTIDSTI